MKYKVVTNESFETYIDYLSRYRGRGKRFEDRWDSLDLDDITTDVNVPSEVEVDDAVRELDLFDDVAVKTGADDVYVGSDGKLRLLDLDPDGRQVTWDYFINKNSVTKATPEEIDKFNSALRKSGLIISWMNGKCIVKLDT